MSLVNTIYIAQSWGLKAEKQSVGKLDKSYFITLKCYYVLQYLINSSHD